MAMKKLGAGWNTVSKTAKSYVNVQITEDIPKGSYIQIWKNDRKQSEKHPDFNIMLSVRN